MKNQFVKHPNLPKNKISLVSAGDYPIIKEALIKEGISVLSFYNGTLSEETARHQDMLLCHTGENNIFLDSIQDKRLLEEKGFRVNFSEKIDAVYPHDVKLNVAVSRDFFICNKKTADINLYEALINSGKRCIHVNQGYSKCSVCFINENAVITEDKAIAKTLSLQNIDVLLISKGDIFLSDSHYGFFGGSTGKISGDTLALSGQISYHRDKDKILGFLRNHNVYIHELTKGKITDIGGIIPLMY